MDLAATLYQRALTAPQQPALIGTERTLSYARLYAAASRGAHRVAAATDSKISEDQLPPRVGLLALEPLHAITGFYSLVLAGISAVVLDPAWPASRLGAVIRQLDLRHVLCDAAGAQALQQVAVPGLMRLPIDLSEEETESLLAPPHIDADRELLVVFTSGTTSLPKAVCRTRHSWQASVRLGSKILHATAGEISLIPGPLAHGLSLYAVVESLTTGGTALLTGRWMPRQVRELLESHRCTRVVAVPSILRRLLEQFDPRLLEGLRYAISGGENLPAPLRRRLQQLPGLEDVVEYYGTSEHSLIAYRSTTTAQRNASTGFAGTPFPGVQLHIAAPDQETGIGEIYVHSPLLASGYHPSGQERFRWDGNRLSVRDMGRFTDGTLFVLGRAGGMLNLGGNNIHPSEISQAMAAALGLAHVEVLLHEEPEAAPRLIAVIQRDELCPTLDAQEIRARLAAVLPTYKIPHELRCVDTWPLTSSGKIAVGRLSDVWSPEGAVLLRAPANNTVRA